MTELVAALLTVHGSLSFLADADCLLDPSHLVGLSDSLSITDASTQFITMFSCRARSVRADLLHSAEVLER